MKLTPNFSLEEFKVSDKYAEIAGRMVFALFEQDRIKLLCESILEPIRAKWGLVQILSGKRSDELNAMVAGSKDSDHLKCIAADFTCPAYPKHEPIFNWIRSENLPYRQVIFYPEQRFIHVSINIPGHQYKHEALKKQDGVYEVIHG